MQFGIKLPHPGLKAGICGVANIFFTKQTELQMMQQSGTKSLNSCNPQLHMYYKKFFLGPTSRLIERATCTVLAPHHS